MPSIARYQADTVAHGLGVGVVSSPNPIGPRAVRPFAAVAAPPSAQASSAQLPVDTVCTFCPAGLAPPLYSILAAPDIDLLPSDHIFLYSLEEHFASRLQQPVFIETHPLPPSQASPHIESPQPSPDAGYTMWIILPMLMAMLVVAFIKVTYNSYFKSFIQGIFLRFPIDRMIREASVPVQRVSYILDLVFFLVLPLWAVSLLDHWDLLLGFGLPSYAVALLVLAALVALRWLRFLFNRTIGFISMNRNSFYILHFNQLVYVRVMALFLPFSLFLFHFTQGLLQELLLYSTLGVMASLLVIRLYRTAQVFLGHGFSIFYFLLYLCALEIGPILVLLRGILWSRF